MESFVMESINFAIMGCSQFALRAMAPAMINCPGIQLSAIASRSYDKAQACARRFDCEAVSGYAQLLALDHIDAVYIPLPTGLHAEWVLKAVQAGKHVLVEKSFVHDIGWVARILAAAKEKNTLVMENFLFPHHAHFAWLKEQIDTQAIGQLQLFRSNFSIPTLSPADIRYNSTLGGGALLDLGAYVVKATRIFLGHELKLIGATLLYPTEREVDMGGSATFANSTGQISQVAFFFDRHYQNTWEFFGTEARMCMERAYTPPPGYAPVVRIERQNHREEITLPSDNHYERKLNHFAETIASATDLTPFWEELREQSYYINLIRESAVKL